MCETDFLPSIAVQCDEAKQLNKPKQKQNKFTLMPINYKLRDANIVQLSGMPEVRKGTTVQSSATGD